MNELLLSILRLNMNEILFSFLELFYFILDFSSTIPNGLIVVGNLFLAK
jgi:hypothetical protein